ncbi:sigma-54-dependent Fis family transcriptional regulator [Halobacillus massiliensis]|uniref:sigma-54-dependent Fis family transcriptional regulator n=1 Tax=Halobacillus massiliensis TaxID=1926286 RepID=UPI0009E42935|nr:sigma-54-dependent Fis family transcriptional regulator [Halobacillus massiliensis]
MHQKDWENFIIKNQVSEEIPEDIIQSWKRSVRHGIRPDLKKAPQIFNYQDIQKIASSSLIHRIFTQVSREMEKYFNKNDFSLNLADSEGRIISSFVEGSLKEQLQEFRFFEGGHWNEAHSGTNAIGTALSIDNDIVIKGPQHFCENWHPFSCAGVPIRHPLHRKTAGVLDLTTINKCFPENALSLTAVFVQSIESLWHAEILQDIEKLRDEFKAYIENIQEDKVIAIDTEGTIIDKYRTSINTMKEYVDPGLVRPEVYEGKIQLENGQTSEGKIVPVRRDGRLVGNIVQIKSANSKRIVNNQNPSAFSVLQGESQSWIQVIENAKRTAKADTAVLITGESGTGKELIARAVHETSDRKNKAFLAANCAALQQDLAPSELFGYVPGAFTGALKTGNKGWFEAADGGTLFLDEISEMPPAIQAMLLRVLQEKQIVRIGERKPRTIDVRIIAASNRNLKEWVNTGKFRSDLYFRLNIARLHLPPLRKRKTDISLLVNYFLQRHGGNFHINQKAMQILQHYHWPGNVRELQNAIECAVLYAQNYQITEQELPAELVEDENQEEQAMDLRLVPERDTTSQETEEKQLIETIESCRYNLTQASKALGISRSTLYRRMKKYKIKV